MKYDDSEYYFLNFETDLDNEAANTHIGMFYAWALLSGLGQTDSPDLDTSDAREQLRARQKTGGELLSDLCDGKLTSDEFNDEGNAFAADYYEKQFHHDYARVFDSQIPSTGHDADDICSVPDTWANFDLIKPVLDRRLADWRAKRKTPELSLVGDPPAAPPPPPAAPRPAPDLAALKRLAEQGDRDAWFQLGAEYITGTHVPRDFKRAADCFEKAAQAGLPEAAFNLGVCFQNGDGRPQDPKQRLRWFALAAEGGHGQATYFLALAYREGTQLPQDFVASNALMMLAQKRGVQEAHAAGVMAGSLQESFALAQQLEAPGQLVALLSARRRKVLAGQVDTGVERWKHGPDAGKRTAEPPAPAPARPGLTLGHVALLLGAAAVVIVPLTGVKSTAFFVLSWALSLTGAAGVFTVAPSLGLGGVVRIIATAVAVLPVIGGFVNLWLVLRWVGRRSS
jgi:hypothetical protein